MQLRALKAIATLLTIVAALIVAPVAHAAGPYQLDAHVDGVASGGDYIPSLFRWADTFEVTFTHTPDSSTVDLMTLAQSHQVVGTATVHETLQGTATITLQMSGVHVEAVRESGDVNDPNGPEETVVLRFTEVTYTFQPILPNGQRNGPPVTFTWKR